MLAEKGIRLTTSHTQSVGIAEYVMWGVLNHFQSGNTHAVEQTARRWTKRRSREISGTRWLIIGFGAIGEAIARRAKGFDAHVTGVRRQHQQSSCADALATPDQIFDHLGDNDVAALCVPQTSQTMNMVDADFLAAMKPGSILVNVGRGSVIDDDALIAALDAGKPGHALLDVFRIEPLPADSRFWHYPRVTVTAHTSALNSGLDMRTDNLFLDNLGLVISRTNLCSTRSPPPRCWPRRADSRALLDALERSRKRAQFVDQPFQPVGPEALGIFPHDPQNITRYDFHDVASFRR